MYAGSTPTRRRKPAYICKRFLDIGIGTAGGTFAGSVVRPHGSARPPPRPDVSPNPAAEQPGHPDGHVGERARCPADTANTGGRNPVPTRLAESLAFELPITQSSWCRLRPRFSDHHVGSKGSTRASLRHGSPHIHRPHGSYAGDPTADSHADQASGTGRHAAPYSSFEYT